MTELRKLFQVCGLHGITLRPQYIQSELNVLAVHLSRLRKDDDWRLNPKIFRHATHRWGMPTVDRFATSNNAQCPRFYSRWADPGAEGRDAFSHSWLGELNWLNPPWGTISRVLHKLDMEGAAAILVVPYWTSQHWWPQLAQMATYAFYVEPSFDTFLPGDIGSRRAVGSPAWGVLLASEDRATRLVLHTPWVVWQLISDMQHPTTKPLPPPFTPIVCPVADDMYMHIPISIPRPHFPSLFAQCHRPWSGLPSKLCGSLRVPILETTVRFTLSLLD